jgi:phosphohistidine phosphatase
MAGHPAPAPGESSRKHRKPLRVLIVRHGLAGDATSFAKTGRPDGERPLTKEGRRKMRKVAKGLTDLIPGIRTIASSPLVRASETADILLKQFARAGEAPQSMQLAALAPGRPAGQVLGWLADRPRDGVVALVGHEPYLSQFVCWTLTGLRESFIEMKKGAACLLEFEQDVRPGRAKLLWALRPGQLRSIAAAKHGS